MFSFRRISCHYCGTRTPYSKTSGITHFNCANCASDNYLDSSGDITDPPAQLTSPPTPRRQQLSRPDRQSSPPPPPPTQTSFSSFTHDLPSSLAHQETQVFCKTCLHNQHILSETLANYLPDESDPRYHEFEAALPRYRQQLEARYPQVCKVCAPRAQAKIERADYYGVTSNVERNVRRGGLGAGSADGKRETAGRRVMRGLLDGVGWVGAAAVAAQVAWHGYGILAALGDGVLMDRCGEELDCSPEAKLGECTMDLLRLQVDGDCYATYSTYMPMVLLLTTALLWWNPCLRDWYHPTYRYEAIQGRADHFRLQLLQLAIRTVAWYKLSDPTFTSTLSRTQLLGAHACIILLLLASHYLSKNTVQSVRWRYKGKMTPKPTDQDVLGAYAGPADEPSSTPQRSTSSPYDLFAKQKPQQPFPIDSLSRKHQQIGTDTASRRTPTATANTYANAPPSPPDSETNVDDYAPYNDEADAMDIDSPRATRTLQPYQPNQPNTSSWAPLRTETFRLHSQQTNHHQQAPQQKLSYQPIEPSPFRGRLPQAPMSLERRARNPPTQVAFRRAPESKQQNFLAQMRQGIEEGRTFSPVERAELRRSRDSGGSGQFGSLSLGVGLGGEEDGWEREGQGDSVAKSRTRGQLELRASGWQLQRDLDCQSTGTGLEEMFTGGFRLDDDPLTPAKSGRRVGFGGVEGAGAAADGAEAGAGKGLGGLEKALGAVAWKQVVLVLVPAVLAAMVFDFGGMRRGACLWLVERLDEWGY